MTGLARIEAPHRGWGALWSASLALFVLGGLGGVLYRASLLEGAPWGLHLGHIRHAHSHLMMMGWATPGLFVLLRGIGEASSGRPAPQSLLRWSWASWAIALSTFPVFMIYGYRRVDILGRFLPLGAMLSGLCVVAWYGWVWSWWRWLRGVERSTALRLGDMALGLLVISSWGGWGQMYLVLRKVDSLFWQRATIHLFVDLFSEGWVVLGGLAGLWSIARPGDRSGGWTLPWLTAAMPALFILAVPQELVSSSARLLGGVAGVVAALGLGVHGVLLWPRASGARRALRWPLVWLGVHGVSLVGLAWPALASWGEAMGLRVPYLHVVFVGFLTPVLILSVDVSGWRRRGAWVVASLASCGVLLGSLAPMTGLWPAALSGRWVLWCALCGASVLTVVMSLGVWRSAWGQRLKRP